MEGLARLVGVFLLFFSTIRAQNTPPQFDQNVYGFSVPEGEPPGNFIGMVSARDNEQDQLAFGIVSSSEELFRINITTGVITNAVTIDREALLSSVLPITVRVTDGFHPPSVAQVFITIVDINDNEPFFVNLPNSIPLPENTLVGTSVYRVDASDEDQSLNAAILYSIEPNDTFSIHPSSGVVTLDRTLDYDGTIPNTFRNYYLTILARDRAIENPLTNTSSLNITILDVNDQDPIFVPALYSAVVHENLTMGATILQVTAMDQDEGVDDDIIFSISGGNTMINGTPSFAINESTGWITVNVPQLDREEVNQYTLSIMGAESESTTNRAFATVTISVLDINDHIPTFEQQIYLVNISELAQINDTVIELAAFDRDEDANGRFEFTLVNTTDDQELPFAVSSETIQNMGIAQITLTQPLDFENQTSYQFMVVATETIENDARSNFAQVVVYVENENDNDPVFNEDSYSMVILENTIRGSFIALVSAEDDDSGSFGELEFRLSENDRNKPFAITTLPDGYGRLSTTRPLDFEAAETYYLTVIAEDLAAIESEKRSDSVNVTVSVINLNDNPPVFVRDGRIPIDSVRAMILEEIDPPYTVTTLQVFDADDLLNNLTFSIVNEMPEFGHYSIDEESGVINTTIKLDFDLVTLPQFAVLNVSVNDTTFTDYLTVNIEIVDINDNSPMFLNESYSFEVIENSAQGTVIGQVQATDDDSGTFGQIEYRLYAPSDSFDVNVTTGEIYTTASIDREETPGPFEIVVIASDLDSNLTQRNTDSVNVTIYVLDLNDNNPVFSEDVYMFSVAENSDQLPNFAISANDTDLGLNGTVFYTLVHSSSEYTFVLDPTSGVITLNSTVAAGQLDFEETQMYILNVSAEDMGEPSNTAVVQVLITITDENDNVPVFATSVFNATIFEDALPNQSVTTITAEDRDSGDFGTVYYSITDVEPDDTNGTFSIDNSTGVVRTVGTYDREDFADEYAITIEAQDGGTPPNSDTTTLVVSILDINDNAPMFGPVSPPMPSLAEEQGVGVSVASFTATDQDEEDTQNSQITFTIAEITATSASEASVDPTGHFLLNVSSGGAEVLTNASLDFEEITAYSIRIIASDSGDPAMSSEIVIPVTVVDVNDNAPEFLFAANASYYEAVISENAPFTRLVELSAVDRDSGRNAQFDFLASGGFPDPPFTIQGNDIAVRDGSLDFEQVQIYMFNVTVRDRGSRPLSDEALVVITVTDENDNPPVFQPTKQYMATVDEGDYTSNSTFVLYVNATDIDSEAFGNVSYVVFPASTLFSVHILEGEVRVEGVLDRETLDSYTITILARDGGSPPQTATATVFITVEDVNDNNPILSQQVYTASIPEEASPEDVASILASIPVSATDADLGASGQVLFLLNNDTDFLIDEATGEISSRRAFDYETEQYFTLEIIANDNVTDPLSDSAVLNITILDINDNTPILEEFPVNVSFPENIRVGTSIANISASDLDSTVNSELVYQLANDEGKFSITEDGRIILADTLDRESTDFYNLTVTVSDRGQPVRFATDYLPVVVTDINDEAPQLNRTDYNFLVSEDVELNSTLGVIRAVDLDRDMNGEVEFEIVSGDRDRFSLVTMQLDSRQTYEAWIINNQLFDYEDVTSYALTVRVQNPVAPPFRSTASVLITLRDTNDNPPVFSLPGGYNIPVPEEALLQRPIGTVVATDADGGINGTVRYGFAANTDRQVLNTFSINNETGVITLTAPLDHEQQPLYEFVIEARDLSVVPLTSNVSVIVTVEDTNENAPVFDMASYSAALEENLPAGSLVTRVNATESETGGSTIRYSLAAGEIQQFVIDERTGIILTNASLDREFQDSYVLTVQARDTPRDATARSLSSFVQVVVEVLDDNDNNPDFGINSIRVNLPESSAVNVTLPEVYLATDDDIGSNGDIRYFLSPDDSFTVNTITGVISVRDSAALDRETTPTIPLLLIAMDQGSNPRRAVLDIFIDLDDINDNSPFFSAASYSASVPEDSEVGISVARVLASDRDLDTVSYSIISGDDTERKFRINAQGLIETTAVPLDREDTAMYRLVVAATDSGTPQRMNTTIVTVTVTDVNDHSPQCTQSLFSFTAAEANMFPVQLGSVMATDMDGPDVASGQLSYRLGSTNLRNNITVSSSGMVFGEPGLDYEALDAGSFQFDVIVTDQGVDIAARRSATCQVMVTLTDENDNVPVFEESQYEVSILENERVGATVAVVTARDRDSGANGEITYSFLTRVNVFSIDSESGQVTLTGTLDREIQDLYEVEVRATDGGSEPRSGTARLRITVRNVDDNSPRFNRSFYEQQIPENIAVDSMVLTVLATDDDTLPSNVRHSFLRGNTQDRFRIGLTDGIIRVNQPLDRESIPVFTLVVIATDGTNNGTTTVRIILSDVNDERPVFQEDAYVALISENSLEGTPVLPSVNGTRVPIQALDRDEPNTANSQVMYHLTGPNAINFNIDPSSGVVTVARGVSLDYEATPELLVTVVATDSNPVSPMSTSVLLTVRLNDTNDEAPMFSRPFGYIAVVPEDQPVNSVLTKVSADDRDTVAVSGRVRYALTSSTPFSALPLFSINRTTGEISLIQSLDRESDPVITLVVTASDMGEPAQSSVVNVRITVTDINDNAPRFDRDVYTTVVPEFLARSESALQVTATDPDAAGANSQVSYRIMGTSSFNINPTTGDVFTIAFLDYEEERSHSFMVEACDSGTPMLCAETRVRINVADFNDEPPTFDQDTYRTDVCLSAATTGTDLVQPVASDRDSGSNAELLYSFISPTSTLFAINAVNGRLSIAQEPTMIGSYTMTVMAQDMGDNSLSDTAQVIIRIVNCSAGNLYFRQPFQYYEIQEGQNSFAGRLSTLRLDLSDTPEDVTFAPNPPTNPFTNVLNNLALKAGDNILEELRQGNGLDREARSLYTVVVRARDSNQQETYTSVTLRVLDSNDHRPEFLADLLVFSVPENQTAPYIVGTVQATDRDQNPNLAYQFVGVAPAAFMVNNNSGVITTTTALDREEVDFYELTVQVSDGTFNAENDLLVQVHVQDINDCDPEFVESEYRFSISENLPRGSRVGAVMATDCDLGSNSELRYTIEAGNVGVFQVDLETGVITTLTTLDFEQASNYSLTVRATDMGLPTPRFGNVNVLFSVLDVNECPPLFINPPRSISVLESVTNNSVINIYTVQDCDSGLNGVDGAVFNIIAGNEDGTFHLSSANGVGTLTLVRSLDREQQSMHTITIQAMDSAGINSLSSVTDLTLIVLDANDNSPMFAEEAISITVSEGADLEQTLLQVSASDADAGSNAEIFYSLDGDDTGIFEIEEVSGRLSLSRSLDREMNDSFVVQVIARDGGLEPRSSNTTIFITVTDVNDNDPVITNIESGATVVTVTEGMYSGGSRMPIFAVSGMDADLGVNALLSYSLETTNLPFQVDSGGVIFVSGDLDYETRIRYSLVVVATDAGTPTRRGIATLMVEVTDRNDNNPIFDQAMYSAEQDEEQDVGTSILTVRATDRDQIDTNNSLVAYSFNDASDASFFYIDNMTGIISNAMILDREVKSSYSFGVIATNYLSDVPLFGEASVNITLRDINDEIPVMGQAIYTATINETTPVGTPVLTVTAMDADMPNTPNSDLIYSLSRVTNVPFFIDANTGELSVQNPLDYEAATSYSFEAVVEDKGEGPNINRSAVIVNITDNNDQIPTFSQQVYTARVLENSSPGRIALLDYSDRDALSGNTDSEVSIVQPTDNDLFSIGDLEGNAAPLLINRGVDYEMVTSYTLNINVTNRQMGVGQPCAGAAMCTLSSSARVNVEIVDANDNTPVFQQSVYTGEISSSTQSRTSILAVRATDADSSSAFRTVRYQLRGNSSQFLIDGLTGVIFTRGSFEGLDGVTYILNVSAVDNAGNRPFNEAFVTVRLIVLNDFQRIAIIFNNSLDTIIARQDDIVSVLEELTNYMIVVEDYEDYSTPTQTTFLFHAIDNGDILDFDEFASDSLVSQLTLRLQEEYRLRILRIESFGDVIVGQAPVDTETIVILILCLFLIIGAIVVLIAAFSQRYLALHAARHKLLADVFYGSHAGSSIMDQQENIQLQLVETGQSSSKPNPMFVHPYDNWAGVDTSGVESVGGDSTNLQRDNPLYESQEIRMEMFADVSDEEEEGGDEADEAELLAAALQEDSDLEDEDNSVTAI